MTAKENNGYGDGKNYRNPYGRKGCPEHQKVIEDIKESCKEDKIDWKTEKKFDTPDGRKNYRAADIVEFDKESNEVSKIHQVGKTNKNGTPVAREVEAIEDIKNCEKYNGAPVYFWPYDRPEIGPIRY